MRRSILLCLALFVIFLTAHPVKADLSSKQARKLIARMAGFELPSQAVHVRRVSTVGATSAEATVEIELPFRFAKDSRGQWDVHEIRTGANQWQGIEIITRAFKSDRSVENCAATNSIRLVTGSDLSVKLARCLIATLFDIKLPSDAVRIKDVSQLNIPLASQTSALVMAIVRADVRFTNEGRSGWRVSGVRTNGADWSDLDAALAATNDEKKQQARQEMELIAQALERFRAERGFYVVSDKEAVLIDHLSPRYISRVIRLDPWHMPYEYKGEPDRFTLRSSGPDGKKDTSDDIVLNSSGR
jgi:hypothetical protein